MEIDVVIILASKAHSSYSRTACLLESCVIINHYLYSYEYTCQEDRLNIEYKYRLHIERINQNYSYTNKHYPRSNVFFWSLYRYLTLTLLGKGVTAARVNVTIQRPIVSQWRMLDVCKRRGNTLWGPEAVGPEGRCSAAASVTRRLDSFLKSKDRTACYFHCVGYFIYLFICYICLCMHVLHIGLYDRPHLLFTRIESTLVTY